MPNSTNTTKLMRHVRSADEGERQMALEAAKTAGADAIEPLAEAMADNRPECARTAVRALWNVVWAHGAPGSGSRDEAGERLLLALEQEGPVAGRRELLWMVADLCDTERAVAAVAALLEHPELREDARLALERLPGEEAVPALESGFVRGDGQFKYAVAASLRKRGRTVEGYPCQKLLPAKVKR